MVPQSYFLQIFIIFLMSFPFSFCSYQKTSLSNDPTFSYSAIKGQETGFAFAKHASKYEHLSSRKIVNVDSFGAKANGRDDTKAFQKAWKEACSSHRPTTLLVPRMRVYHLKPISFEGPCKSQVNINLYGTINASPRRSDYRQNPLQWLVFEKLSNLVVGGGGTINGNGRIWWENSCKINRNLPCTHAPTALTFLECKNLKVGNLRIKNAQQMHLTFQDCENVKASNLIVVAPRRSPNTDGIHVTGTQNIQIMNSLVKTGDDCVSIVSGSKNVKVTDLICGPGHGISIGSLGKDNSEDYVSNVLVDRARLSGTTNGVRIKTWQGGSGYAKNIRFQNIVMHNVTNPIIIDQNYCDRQDQSCPEQKSAVQVQDVVYQNIRGTSASKEAIKFDCSKSTPCRGILLQNINIRLQGDGDSKALCSNINVVTKEGVFPLCSDD